MAISTFYLGGGGGGETLYQVWSWYLISVLSFDSIYAQQIF